MTQEFIEEMHKALLREESRLKDELKGLSPHTEIGNAVEDNVEEIELDEVNQAVINRINADLQKIQKALKRIETGTYGKDEQGNKISEDRLRALPWADTAI